MQKTRNKVWIETLMLSCGADRLARSAGDRDGLRRCGSNEANGGLAYVRQQAFELVNASMTWASPTGRYSVTGYVRNIFDESYKLTVLSLSRSVAGVWSGVATEGDPQTWGAVFNVRF